LYNTNVADKQSILLIGRLENLRVKKRYFSMANST